MKRATTDEIEKIIQELNELLPDKKFIRAGAYGMQKLESANGAHDESGFMSKRELINWLYAYRRGIYAKMEGTK